MRKIILMLTAIMITSFVFAQKDTINIKRIPPEINNTDGINKTDWNNHNYDKGTIDNSPKNDQMPTRKDKSDSPSNKSNSIYKHADGYFMQDGKMMYSKNGNITNMDKNFTYPNGTTINMDGTYLTPEGKKNKLSNGQHLDNSGKIVPNK